jgi:hypothetical protein
MTVRRHDHSKPDPNMDELRRELRAMGRDHAREMRAMETTTRAFLESDASPDQRVAALVGRRRFLTLGGASVATAAVLAACGGESDTGLARVGNAPTTTALPDAVVNDVVILRTASSIEYTAINVYDLVIDNSDLLDPALRDVARRFRDDHAGHAAIFERLTTEAGGEPFTCENPRLKDVLIDPVLRAITGAEATATLPARPPSDDPRRDVLNFAHGLEAFAGATYQSVVPALSLPSLRREAVVVGSHEVRHAAVLALAITGTPAGYVDPAVATAAGQGPPIPEAPETDGQEVPATEPVEDSGPTATAIPPVYAINSQFGLLSAVPVVLGAGDENGVRLTVRLDTPSLNTFVYEYLTPSC